MTLRFKGFCEVFHRRRNRGPAPGQILEAIVTASDGDGALKLGRVATACPRLLRIGSMAVLSAIVLACSPPSRRTLQANGAACDCSRNLYDCRDFGSQKEAQACFDFCRDEGAGDVHRLDADGDGIACEWNP